MKKFKTKIKVVYTNYSFKKYKADKDNKDREEMGDNAQLFMTMPSLISQCPHRAVWSELEYHD